VPSRRLFITAVPLSAAATAAGILVGLRSTRSASATWASAAEPAGSTLTPTAPTAPSASPTLSPTPSPSATSDAVALAARRTALTKTLDAYVKKATVRFAVALVDGRTGNSYLYKPTTAFETASIVKVDILATLLLRAQDNGRSLTSSESSLATRMIRASDNDAATSLWNAVGGASGVSKANRRLGLTTTHPSTEGWGLTTTTVRDQTRLLAELADSTGPLSAKSQKLELNLMSTVNGDQDWGVSAAARSGEKTAVKNGWLSRDTESGRWIINTVGRITGSTTDLRMAVLSHGHAGMTSGVSFVEDIAELVRQRLQW
jgi:beta-lactamase class A